MSLGGAVLRGIPSAAGKDGTLGPSRVPLEIFDCNSTYGCHNSEEEPSYVSTST